MSSTIPGNTIFGSPSYNRVHVSNSNLNTTTQQLSNSIPIPTLPIIDLNDTPICSDLNLNNTQNFDVFPQMQSVSSGFMNTDSINKSHPSQNQLFQQQQIPQSNYNYNNPTVLNSQLSIMLNMINDFRKDMFLLQQKFNYISANMQHFVHTTNMTPIPSSNINRVYYTNPGLANYSMNVNSNTSYYNNINQHSVNSSSNNNSSSFLHLSSMINSNNANIDADKPMDIDDYNNHSYE